MNQIQFKLNQHVFLNGARGKIIQIYKPMGTYPMYQVQLFTDGSIHHVAKHQLVKSLPSEPITCTTSSALISTALSRNPVNSNSTCSDTAAANDQTPNASDTPVYFNPTVSSPVEAPSSITSHSTPTSSSAPAVSQLNTTSSRFIDMSNNEYKEFKEQTENANTKRKTESDIKLLKDYLLKLGEIREISDISAYDLDNYISKFIVCVRQKDGSEYEPSSLRGIIGSIDRYLRQQKYSHSIIRDHAFNETRSSLKSKQKDLRKKGKGNRPNQSDDITDNDIDKLYEAEQLGMNTPTSIINTLWFYNTLQFGIRAGGQEHRQILWGDIELKFDEELDSEYLEFNERQTKTRTGENVNNIREQCPRMYAFEENWERCPVECYKEYRKRRPHGFSAPHHPFYLAPVTHTTTPTPSETWFIRGPIGRHKLAAIMKTIAKNAELPNLKTKKITNTSVRKYLCQKLIENNIPDTHAIHITGHKNTDSLNNYRRLTNRQQQSLSTLLSDTSAENSGSNNHNVYQTQPVPARTYNTYPTSRYYSQTEKNNVHQIRPSQSAQSWTTRSTLSTSHTVKNNVQQTRPPQSAQTWATRPTLATSQAVKNNVYHAATSVPRHRAPELAEATSSQTGGNVNMPMSSPLNHSVTLPNFQFEPQRSVFTNSVIQGGAFTINIHYHAKTAKRPRVIYSDSD